METRGIHRHHILAARILISLVFIISGFIKVSNFSGTVGYIASIGLPFATLMTIVAIVFELGGGLMLIVGWKTKRAAYALIVFTIIATFLVHNILIDSSQMTSFLKNLAIIGGLVLLSESGPGSYSLSRK